MVFPLYDEKGSQIQGFRPWATWSLIVCNVLVFLYLRMFPGSFVFGVTFKFGLIPTALVHSLKGESYFQNMRPELTLLTHTFLHAAWWHLLGNLLALWVFGDDVEQATGRLRFLLLYFLSGIGSGLAHTFTHPDSMKPLIGASGAIAGVVGAYVLLRPRAKVVVLLVIVPVRIAAMWVIAIWLALQVLGVLMSPAEGEIVSYWGHIGGFVVGSLALLLLRRPDVPLFGRTS